MYDMPWLLCYVFSFFYKSYKNLKIYFFVLRLFISLVSLLKYYSHYGFASCMQCTVKDARWGCWFTIHDGVIRSTRLFSSLEAQT